ncbi:hypothetical protein NNO59_01990 [Enterococcus faecium]|nr:hypothetical protein [Enterococcus faecium]
MSRQAISKHIQKLDSSMGSVAKF